MKKVITFIIIMVLMISQFGSALAEKFSIRNGVQFGMSKSEVIEIEKNNGLKLRDSLEESTISYYGNTALSAIVDSLAGFSGYDYRDNSPMRPEIEYGFINKSLFRIRYRLDSWCDSNDSTAKRKILNQFEELNRLLSDKYDLIADSDKASFSIIDLKPSAPSYIYNAKEIYYGFSLHSFKQFLAVDEDKYVDIWLCLWSSTTLLGDIAQYHISLEYTSVDSEAVQKYLKSVQSSGNDL